MLNFEAWLNPANAAAIFYTIAFILLAVTLVLMDWENVHNR
jgi:hypothetical protein